MNTKKFWITLNLVAGLILIMLACEEPPKPAPTPNTPRTEISAPSTVTTVTPPTQITEQIKALPVGMKPGERYHDIHTSKLNLKCETCHTRQTETYSDPMAQVSNPVDKRACLSCHAEGSIQPFYGTNWGNASVKK